MYYFSEYKYWRNALIVFENKASIAFDSFKLLTIDVTS